MIVRNPKPANRKSEIQNQEWLYPMHSIEQIFALSIDMHAQLSAFAAKTLFQFRSRRLGTRSVCDDHHREFPLYHSLVDVHDTAIGLGQNLRHAGNGTERAFSQRRRKAG